ncbi:MAG: hypothetical protein JWP64_3116 [Pseudonocardia sp.]|nr:hypothetical protein [Pseudonocardia sp.]
MRAGASSRASRHRVTTVPRRRPWPRGHWGTRPNTTPGCGRREALKRFRRDPAVPATSFASDRNQPSAVEAANLYQSNTSWNLDQAFRPFDPPPAATPNMVDATSASGPALGDPGSVGMHSADVLGAGSGQSAMPAGGGDGVAPVASLDPPAQGERVSARPDRRRRSDRASSRQETPNARGGGTAGVTAQAGRGRGTGSLPNVDLPPHGVSAGTTGGGGSRSRPGLAGSGATSRRIAPHAGSGRRGRRHPVTGWQWLDPGNPMEHPPLPGRRGGQRTEPSVCGGLTTCRADARRSSGCGGRACGTARCAVLSRRWRCPFGRRGTPAARVAGRGGEGLVRRSAAARPARHPSQAFLNSGTGRSPGSPPAPTPRWPRGR